MMLKDDDCLKNTEIMKFQDFNKVYGKIAPELNEFWNEEHPIWKLLAKSNVTVSLCKK